MNVEFAASAESQLLEALRYIAADRPSAAMRLLDRVEAALDQLRVFPDSGRRLPEFPATPYREIIVPLLRVIYRRSDDRLTVVAVRHDARRKPACERLVR